MKGSYFDPKKTELEFVSVELVGGEGRNEALEIELVVTDAGALVPRSTRPGETTGPTIGAAELQLMVGRDRFEVDEGDLVTTQGEPEDRMAVDMGRARALGVGALHLTDQRAIGLVWQSTAKTKKLAAWIQEDGTGSVLIFTVARRLLNGYELKTDFGDKVKSAELTGACFIDLIAPLAMLDDTGERFRQKPDKRVVEQMLREFCQEGHR